DFLVRVRKGQRMDRSGGLIEERASRVDLGIFKVLPRPCQGERKDVPGVLVPLDGHAGLTPDPDHEEACLYVDLDELEGDTLLIRHEWQVAFSAVKRKRRPAGDHERVVCGQ